jgi:hypothetical protein
MTRDSTGRRGLQKGEADLLPTVACCFVASPVSYCKQMCEAVTRAIQMIQGPLTPGIVHQQEAQAFLCFGEHHQYPTHPASNRPTYRERASDANRGRGAQEAT